MDKESAVWLAISNVLTGIGAGVLLAAVLLFLFSRFGFSLSPLMRFLFAAIAASLPFLLDGIARRGMNPMAAQGIMISLSLFICLFYVYLTAANDLAVSTMTRAVLMPHLCALAAQIIRWGIIYAGNRKEKE